MANRLAFINFCNKNRIKAKLVYINFINSYDKPGSCGNLNVKSKKEWDKIWEEEYKDLGITENQLKEILYHVYIDCTASEMK